jgi:2,3,4,5-tetrahydropyridine-2-carboxylate N-succinyltransferase
MFNKNNREFLASLENGTLRVTVNSADGWIVNHEVKQRILDLFLQSEVIDMPSGFRDKAPFTTRSFTADDKVRMVPGGTSVRAGSYVGKNVVIMPPSYINIGAYVDDGTMIDSHVLVGSCAQVGKRVHLSAGVQIGGVLEPIGNRPVIIEDDCFLGAGVIVVEGILVRKKAVLAPGVVLSASVPIYDAVNETILNGEIPQNAVVVAGSRMMSRAGNWHKEHSLHLSCAIIIKYRDEKTDASISLEDVLRS